METAYYVVESIDGDYANLRRTDKEVSEPKFIARALIPFELMEGMKLKYEFLTWEVIE